MTSVNTPVIIAGNLDRAYSTSLLSTGGYFLQAHFGHFFDESMRLLSRGDLVI
jgi:hypothetical protein